VWKRKSAVESSDKGAPVKKLASPSQRRHDEAMAKQEAFLVLRQDELHRQSAVPVMFSYEGLSLAGSAQTSVPPVNGAAGAQEKSLKTVFEEMDVMEKLNIPGSGSDLELTWKDPEDQEDIVWSLNQSADVNMSFFKDVKRVKIRVVKKDQD
jgi:hypothetical protein